MELGDRFTFGNYRIFFICIVKINTSLFLSLSLFLFYVFHCFRWYFRTSIYYCNLFYFPKGPQPYDINSCGMVQYCFLGCIVGCPFREMTREIGYPTDGVGLSVVIADSSRRNAVTKITSFLSRELVEKKTYSRQRIVLILT